MVVPPVAIYGAAATSYSLAKELYELVKAIKDFDGDVKELKAKFIDNEQKFEVLVTGFQEIRDDVTVKHGDLIEALSQHLNEKLTSARIELKKTDSGNRLKWPFIKNAVSLAVGSLSEWVTSFEARYVMLPEDLKKKFQANIVNAEYKAERDGPLAALTAHIAMKAEQLKSKQEDPETILSTIKPEPPDEERRDVRRFRYRKEIIKIPEDCGQSPVLLRSFRLEVAKLAAVLQAANPKLAHLPKAVSWFEQTYEGEKAPHSLGIAYEVRDDVVAQMSLKAVISLGPPKHTLSDRMKLALNLVSAMAYVRGLELVHKAVRSSNVLLCYGRNDGSAPEKLGQVNLVGFTFARRGTGETRSTGNENEIFWEDQVYCHPDRQTINIMKDDQAARQLSHDQSLLSPGTVTTTPTQELPYYKYMHDIYSIGVVLLEIGLWQNITPIDSDLRRMEPDKRKETLLQMAEETLPVQVGMRYTSLVKACLRVNDNDESIDVSEVLSRLSQIQV